MPISNGSLLIWNCDNLTGWVDADNYNGVSELATNAPVADPVATSIKFDTNTATAGNQAYRYQDIGSIGGLGNRFVVSFCLYCDAIGTIAANDFFQVNIWFNDNWYLNIKFASDGLFIYGGGSSNEVGTNIVVQKIWQEWTLNVNLSGGVNNAVCDVYLDNALKALGINCSKGLSVADGRVDFQQHGYTTNDRISYLDWFMIGDNFVENAIFFGCNF